MMVVFCTLVLVVLALMTVKGGTSQACAACKFQRRRCTPDCVLAPYFPANKPEMFRNAHRLFGVRNIVRILENLRDDQKDEAMKSIIYESDMREKFPVHGCTLVILQLREQVIQQQGELFYVNSLLAKFRNKDHINDNLHIQTALSPQYSPTSPFQLGLVPGNDQLGNFHYQPMSNEIGFSSNPSNNNNLGFVDQSSDDAMGKAMFWIQQQQHQQLREDQQERGSTVYYGNNNNLSCDDDSTIVNMSVNVNSFEMKSSHGVSYQGMPLQQEIEVVSHEYEDMPFDTIVDDTQSYMESAEVCESSVESPLKDTLQSMDAVSQTHELKSAAACFSLTSVNQVNQQRQF